MKLSFLTFFLFVILTELFGQSVKYGSLNLYLFCDTLDARIGKSCAKDRLNMISFFEKVASGAGLNLKLYDYSGKVNWQQKLKTISENPTCLNGTVNIVYLSSHGYKNVKDSSSFPTIILPTGEGLSLVSFHNSIASYFESVCFPTSNCIIITIADVCNNYNEKYRPGIINISRKSGSKDIIGDCSTDLPTIISTDNIVLTQKQADAFFYTFRKSYGNVIIASSSPGQNSLADNEKGSLFTTAFLETFEQITSLKGYTDWAEIIEQTRSKTPKIPIFLRQTAFYYIPYGDTERDILRLSIDTTNSKESVYFLNRMMPGGKIIPFSDPAYPRELFSISKVDYILTMPSGKISVISKSNIREYFKIIIKKNKYINVSMKLYSKFQWYHEKKLVILNYSKFPGELNYHCWCNLIKPALDCHEKR